jgi:peroxiredoxin
MKKLGLLLLSGFIFFNSCKQNGAKITGTISNTKSDTLYLISGSNMEFVDSVYVVDGKFTYNKTYTEPTPVQVVLKSSGQSAYIFLENSNITIDANANDLQSIKIKGCASETEFASYLTSLDPLQAKMKSITERGQLATSQAAIDSLNLEYTAILADKGMFVKAHLKAHPSSCVSAFLAYSDMVSENNLAKIETFTSLLDAKAMSTSYGKNLQDHVATLKSTAIGSVAPEFKLNNTDGKEIALNSFRGKYLLIDFWASWCNPCRLENPNVVAAFNKYKTNTAGFDILSVSLDEDAGKWKDAIAKDNLTWTHVSDLKGWTSKIATQYGVQSIPANVLIDKQGKIIAKNVYGASLDSLLNIVLK